MPFTGSVNDRRKSTFGPPHIKLIWSRMGREPTKKQNKGRKNNDNNNNIIRCDDDLWLSWFS